MDKTLTHKGTEVVVSTTKYIRNNALAVGLCVKVSDDEIETYMMLSTNLDEPADEGCFWLKTWSENTGIDQWLIEHGIAIPTGRTQRAGYCTAFEFKLLPQ